MIKLTLLVILPIFLFVFIGFNNVYGQISQNAPTFQTIDISSTPNVNDLPYGITCDDSTYRYMTLFSQGALVRVNKANNSVTIFDNDNVSSGEDWYSVVRTTSGKLFINEKDTGLVRVFDTGTNTFSSFPVVEDVSGGLVSYTTSYSSAPNKITVNESGGGHGNHNYDFGFGSFGELKFTGGYVWQTLDYSIDFDSTANGLGVNDVSFHGIVRIDPTNNSVTRYSIVGANTLRGLSVDVSDSTVLWVVDNSVDKLYKFDTNTGSVLNTISLTSSSKARGVTNDGSFVYIAENVSGNGVNTSRILKVAKSNFSISEIDTGAVIGNSKSGTFSVTVANNMIIWTDQSNHMGTISTLDNSQKITYDTSGNSISNHFGCVDGGNFVFAGQGSVHLGVLTLSGSSSTHGDSCKGDCYSPHLGNDENSKYFYNDGLRIIGKNFDKTFEIKNILHNVSNETIDLPVGEPITFILKGQDTYPDNIVSCEIAIGLQKGHFVKQDALFILGVKRSFDSVKTLYSEGDQKAFRDFNADIKNIDDNVFCVFNFVPTHHYQNDMFALQLVDMYGYDGVYFVNHGIRFYGISEIGTPMFKYFDDFGRVHVLTILDKSLEDMTKAVDENGDLWSGDFGKLWSKDYVRSDTKGSFSINSGYDRNDYYEFKAYKLGQELLAQEIFDSKSIQNKLGESIPMSVSFYERLHNSVPNMSKAIIEYEKSKPDTIVRTISN